MKTNTFLTTGQVCQELNIPRYKLVYLFEQLIVPEPQKIGGRRLYNEHEVNLIKEILERRKAKRKQK